MEHLNKTQSKIMLNKKNSLYSLHNKYGLCNK